MLVEIKNLPGEALRPFSGAEGLKTVKKGHHKRSASSIRVAVHVSWKNNRHYALIPCGRQQAAGHAFSRRRTQQPVVVARVISAEAYNLIGCQ